MSISRPRLSVGYRRNYLVYQVLKLYRTITGGFDGTFIARLQVTDLSVAKSVALHKVARGEVPMIKTADATYVYHPRYRKWYKNLSDAEMQKYFDWL